MDSADSIAYKDQVRKAYRKQQEEYGQAQRYFLRPMRFNGKVRTPFFDTPQILGLMEYSGNNEISIEKFNREYEGIYSAYIKGMIVGTSLEGLPMPKPVEYAKMRNYNVTFKKGDIIKNPQFDPALEERFYRVV